MTNANEEKLQAAGKIAMDACFAALNEYHNKIKPYKDAVEIAKKELEWAESQAHDVLFVKLDAIRAKHEACVRFLQDPPPVAPRDGE